MGFGNGVGIERLAAALLLCQLAVLADETNKTKEVKPPAKVEAASPLASSFQIKKGFRIELAVADSMVTSPVAMAFDENGRLFVVEMRDYPNRREQVPHLGRVRLLEDTDGDGVFDSSTVYADNLAWPSAVACYDGGIFVAATPEILYFKDRKSNGVADLRKVVFTGFGEGTGPTNSEALLNNFVWGLDNRIHGGSAGIGGSITSFGASGAAPVVLGHDDFSFDPRSLTLSVEAGPARTGLCFDARGRKFACGPRHPLEATMFEPRYFARNPLVARPPELVDVASPSTRIFRWESDSVSVASAAQVRGASTKAQASNSLAAAWLAQPRSCLIYRGNAFPSNFLGNVFICEPDAHVIHRALLVQNGLELVAQRPADELNTEFLVGKDKTFRPAQIVAGPDSALYIADLDTGGDHGRIWRIVPETFKRPKTPQLGKAKTYDLAATLAHADGWHRDTAARLLYERRDPETPSLLTNMVNRSRIPQARLQALRLLDGLGALTEPVVLQGLRDADDRVREHAIALSERLIEHRKLSDAAWNGLAALTGDPSVRVRYQLAFTLGEFERQGRLAALADVLRRDIGNRWLQAAVLSSLSKGAVEFLIALAGEGGWRNDTAGLDFLNQLATMIGVRGQLDEVAQITEFVGRASLDWPAAFQLLSSLGEGLRRLNSSLALVDPQGHLERFYDKAVELGVDETVAEPTRLAALRLWGVSPYTTLGPGDLLPLLVGAKQSEVVRAAAIATLGRYDTPGVITNFLVRWPALSPFLRRQTISVLLTRNDRVPEVMLALEARRISPADFSATQLDFLRSYRDSAISQRALQIFGPAAGARPKVVEQFKGALHTRGDAARGREIFLARCATCHLAGGEGNRFGPDLVSAKVLGKDRILDAILEPNARVSRGDTTYVIETRRGENLIGLIEDENPTAITLRQPGGLSLVWPRLNIQSIELQTWSLMPEGLEQGMAPQNMADLLEYLMTVPR
jgi:putative membrane-bound dehydrogenase-like protein